MKTKRSIAITIVAVVLALLSIAAGIPKMLQIPQELDFLGAIGLSAMGVSILGVVQLAGGGLLPWQRTRLVGTALCSLAFLVSAVAVFVSGNPTFGSISLIPVFLTLAVGYNAWTRRVPTLTAD